MENSIWDKLVKQMNRVLGHVALVFANSLALGRVSVQGYLAHKDSTSLGTCSKLMPRALRWSQGGRCFLCARYPCSTQSSLSKRHHHTTPAFKTPSPLCSPNVSAAILFSNIAVRSPAAQHASASPTQSYTSPGININEDSNVITIISMSQHCTTISQQHRSPHRQY